MFGVVLWSDTQDQKAVIWCEDHGDLAFYTQTDGNGDISLDAGDWVQFDVTVDRHLRFAHNPRLVAEGIYPDLADALSKAVPVQQPQVSRVSAKIIPLAAARSARCAPLPDRAAHRA